MPARRAQTRRPPTGGPPPHRRFPAFALGLLIGAGIAVALLGGPHPHSAPPAPSAPLRASPGAPSATTPVRPVPPRRPAESRLPRQNPEASQSPAVVLPAALPPSVRQSAGGREGGAAEPETSDHPRVAVIFDDAGYSLRAAREVMALPRPVTISVLPGLPFSTPIAEEAASRGVQIILHLPVQPDNPALDPGPGEITVDMTDEAIARTVESDFATVPGAVGANNHMGSRGTADPRVMRAILGVVKAHDLFFVDSLTSPRSVAAQTARAMGVPTAVRAVFLDNQDDETYVRAQFHALIQAAQTRGQAIAIGHVGKVTARVLRDMLPEFDEAGIRFVPVSGLVR